MPNTERRLMNDEREHRYQSRDQGYYDEPHIATRTNPATRSGKSVNPDYDNEVYSEDGYTEEENPT